MFSSLVGVGRLCLLRIKHRTHRAETSLSVCSLPQSVVRSGSDGVPSPSSAGGGSGDDSGAPRPSGSRPRAAPGAGAGEEVESLRRALAAAEDRAAAVERDFVALLESVQELQQQGGSRAGSAAGGSARGSPAASVADSRAEQAQAALAVLEENERLQANLAAAEEACGAMAEELARIKGEYEALSAALLAGGGGDAAKGLAAMMM